MSGSANLPKAKFRGSPRQLLAVGVGLLIGLALLSQCSQEPNHFPNQPVVEIPPPYAGLHFDMHYYDSIEMYPQSERTKRQLAISTQLHRLQYATKPIRNKQGKTLEQAMGVSINPNDSIYESMGDGPVVGFANEAEELADIYRKIDSLKVLENIPLTPHPH